jgi:bifunctional UDP-N-acetylglucosamine pyrophosphorylase/glucosamine-1-phosphate N-acetyltransferase
MNIVILAAGKGTRMQSTLPKVLMPLAGRALVIHVLDTLKHFKKTKTILIVGYEQEKVREATRNYDVSYAEQLEQKGTGHAVQMTVPYLDQNLSETLILCGDVPGLASERKTQH